MNILPVEKNCIKRSPAAGRKLLPPQGVFPESKKFQKTNPGGGNKFIPAAGLYSGTYKLPGSRDLLCDDIRFSPSDLTDGSGISRDDSCHQYKSTINRRAQR